MQTTKQLEEQDLKRGQVCEHCNKKQVSDDGACAWCAYDISEAERFEAELQREHPDFSDFEDNIAGIFI